MDGDSRQHRSTGYGFVLHALACWPTFRGYEPVSEATAAAELGVSIETFKRSTTGISSAA
jgi:hypothetical protein